MSTLQPDDMDWRIIQLLRRENLTNKAIARQLDVSEGTVRQRLKRLKAAGILEVRGLIDPEVLENQQLAVVAITIQESRRLSELAEAISRLNNVLDVSIVSGRYDMLVEILVDSNKGLVTFVTDTLSQVSGIATTESFVVLRSYRKRV